MNEDDFDFGDIMSDTMIRAYFAKIGGDPFSEYADRYVESALSIVDFLNDGNKEYGKRH